MKKRTAFALIALAIAAIGAIVAIGTYLKKRSSLICDCFEDDVFDDDDEYACEEHSCDCGCEDSEDADAEDSGAIGADPEADSADEN